ncbi:tetratricopeptide repeat protein [Congregibacter brevis]|uniref:Tetratricopeptide repeat protein n=1 Tax=Congregibacter brevis TaxID=3081201 RepID=A0ABZ0IEE1_9GAMM|nr:tetratricopeptide repeat protein [Congregibacter sp. IMCC45268]
MSLFSELHRRNVVRVGIAYAVVAWLLLQVADVVMENIGAPEWVMQALLFLLLLGLLPALIFAWVFELTPEGLKRESEIEEGVSVVHQTRRKLDTLIIATLVVAVAYLFWDGRLREPSADTPQVAVGGEATEGTKLTGMDALRQQTEAAAQAKQQSPSSEDTSKDTSIAVLPFVNLSSDPEQEYFSDGISEELLNVLAQIPALRVAARTSSFQFKGDNRDIGEIAQLLKVGHVLEGSVRKAGTKLRITAQLIEAEGGFHLWSETYDRELEDIFTIQDEISAAIADALRAELALDDVTTPDASKTTANTAAYEAFLKGRGLINQRGNQSITAGVVELERSVRLDPNYAPARAQLAIGIALLAATSGTYGDLSIDEVNERAGEQLAAAEAVDDDFAELWAARAILARVNFDDQEYLRNSELALAIRPNYADPLNWRVNALNGLGMAVQAVDAREELLRLDPLSVIGRLNAVTFIANGGEPERALAIARSIASQSPWASHVAQARAYGSEGKTQRQLEQLLLAYSLDSRDLLVNYEIAYALVSSGLLDEALRIDRTVRPWVLLGAGRFEEAEQAFRQAVAADPESLENISSLAASVYFQGRFAEAVELWQQALVTTNFGEAVYSNGGNGPTAQLVFALQKLGKDNAAAEQLAVLEALTANIGQAGFTNFRGWNFGQAAQAVLKAESGEALEALQTADSNGFSLPSALEDPIFDAIRDEPAFEIVRQNVASRAMANREKVLTLICENNPVPDHWRPLEATCLEL